MSNSDDVVLYVVGNIPSTFHAADLRRFFSTFVEDHCFKCFHFKHRPQHLLPISENSSTTTEPQKTARLCALVKLKSSKAKDFVHRYHGKCWTDRDGLKLSARCCIARLKDSERSPKISKLQEFRAPIIMPWGNVGTPTGYFWAQIQQCKLPAGVVQKLGLVFEKQRSAGRGKYSHVPFEYGDSKRVKLESTPDSEIKVEEEANSEKVAEDGQGAHVDIENEVASGMNIDGTSAEVIVLETEIEERKHSEADNSTRPEARRRNSIDPVEDEVLSDTDLEDWERHEMLHDEIHGQDRNKERLFEEELEVVWEKGGSGLVFYTDAYYWDSLAGDFDERTADDWDVDMSGYENDKLQANTLDGRDIQDMRREIELRDGTTSSSSCFKKPSKSRGNKVVVHSSQEHCAIENAPKVEGLGKTVLQKLGWVEGSGLGKNEQGIVEPIVEDGRKPRDTKGLGYHGVSIREKRETMVAPVEEEDRIRIHTVYDDVYSHLRE